jgi:uncharacterized protein (DUF302 family)
MITYQSRKPLDALSKDLEAAVAAHGFGVLGVHDLKAKLEAKGVAFDRACRVFEVCNPQQAKAVLDRDMAISTALPCRIAVYESGGRLELATLEPTRLLAMFGRPELEPVAREVEDALRRIMAAAAGE